MTHANLSLTNKCLGEQEYESTATALLMAGLFVSFLIEYFTHRVANTLNKRGQYNDEVIGVMILEAGIIFHSVRKSSLCGSFMMSFFPSCNTHNILCRLLTTII